MKIFFHTRRLLTLAGIGFGIGSVIVVATARPADAARQPGDVPGQESFPLESPIANPLIKRMQLALRKAGYYKGPIDGRINGQTETAIRTYQRRENMAIDGIVTEQLVGRLESSVKVRALLQQLHRQRLLKMESARNALLRSPKTRRLLADRQRPRDAADPTRDPAPCFAAPTPQCLLAEASESARAVFKDELRYWALSEILVAETKAGLVDRAMDTVRRIEDPRLMIVALRDIAEAQAGSGRPAEALAAADIIPDPLKRAEALAAIATIQATASGTAGNRTGALRTVKLLLEILPAINAPLKRVALQARGAIIQSRTGEIDAAAQTLADAKNKADRLRDRKARSVGLRHVAEALAETGHPGQALEILKNLPEQSEHTPVLVSAAAAQAKAGHADLALVTAETIEIVRYRAVVLGRIAVAQATAGEMAAAERTIEKALKAIKLIKLPFARAYAHERMARALISIARLQDGETGKNTFRRAIASAGRIDDNMLRAKTLWAITDAQRRSGDITAANKTGTLAETETTSIRSKLTRVWMFCNIATDRKAAAAPGLAARAFDRALTLAEGIANPWARARALAYLASTQVDLSASD